MLAWEQNVTRTLPQCRWKTELGNRYLVLRCLHSPIQPQQETTPPPLGIICSHPSLSAQLHRSLAHRWMWMNKKARPTNDHSSSLPCFFQEPRPSAVMYRTIPPPRTTLIKPRATHSLPQQGDEHLVREVDSEAHQLGHPYIPLFIRQR